MKNHPPADPQWLKVTLEGTTSNRDAVGARVELHRADGLRIVEEVRAGGSYQSTSTRSLFFGLGKSSPEMMVIHWPSGKVDSLNSLPVNQDIRIREGDLEPVVASR